jgi:hypothetical protein
MTKEPKNGCLEKKIAVLEERLEGSKDALRLQAAEYERRLDMLNGEAERLRQMQTTYVEKSVYEIAHKYLTEKIDAIQKIVWMAMGGLLLLEIALKYIK